MLKLKQKLSRKELIERIWPLPALEKRQDWLISMKSILPWFRPEQDGEYLCYRLVVTVMVVSTALLGVLLIDLLSKTGLFIDTQAFSKDKLILPVTFSKLIAWPVLALSILFYLRIRFPLNIRDDSIPIIMHRSLLVGYSRKRWLLRCLIAFFGAYAGIFTTHIFVSRFVMHFDKQDNLIFILVTQIVPIVGVSAGAVLLVSYMLVFEKVIRFFPQFDQDLLTMGPLPRSY